MKKEFPLKVEEILETGKSPYDIVQKLREVLEDYKTQNYNFRNEMEVYEKLIEFCDESCKNSNSRFEQCKSARLNRSLCTSCPMWEFTSELYKKVDYVLKQDIF